MAYDADGNLTSDGTFTFNWDSENRLIEIVPITPNTTTLNTRLTFKYDYMGRRVRKLQWAWNDTTQAWDSDGAEAYVYDGWNVVEVLRGDIGTGSDEVYRMYTWGLDMSGTVGGAGGVGGLLAVVDTLDTTTTLDDRNYWYTYDGNGNVGQLIEPLSAAPVVAKYEYDPYGKLLLIDNNTYTTAGTLVSTDTGFANANPFRFSTKWLDDELTNTGQAGFIANEGLYYYGYRYYSPEYGQWTNEDPIEEQGGLNLYGFVGNRPVGNLDPLGRQTVTVDSFTFPIHGANINYCEDCVSWQQDMLVRDADRACECISKAYIIASRFWLWNRALKNCGNKDPYTRWTLDLADGENNVVLETRRTKLASKLRNMMEGCREGFGFECECSCKPLLHGYVYKMSSWSDVHMCPLHFKQNQIARRNTVVHELSHKFGGMGSHIDTKDEADMTYTEALLEDAFYIEDAVSGMCDTFDECLEPL